jgi:hypothetical protein
MQDRRDPLGVVIGIADIEFAAGRAALPPPRMTAGVVFVEVDRAVAVRAELRACLGEEEPAAVVGEAADLRRLRRLNLDPCQTVGGVIRMGCCHGLAIRSGRFGDAIQPAAPIIFSRHRDRLLDNDTKNTKDAGAEAEDRRTQRAAREPSAAFDYLLSRAARRVSVASR